MLVYVHTPKHTQPRRAERRGYTMAKKFYKVNFQYSENVYCANIAIAENVDDVRAHYAKYAWVNVSDAADYEVETAKKKGMPVVEIEHKEPEKKAEKKAPNKAMKKAVRNYYTAAVLTKFAAALEDAKKEVREGTVTTVSISRGNVKMGAVASVSLLPFLTCPGRCKGTCAGICYAAKIANLRASVLKSYARNTALYMLRPDLFWQGVRYAIAGARFFRFHVSGDIPTAEYFAEMVQAAADFPHCQMLAFTKRYEIVNAWIDENGELPANLHILFSGWEDMEVNNPHNLPETNVYDTEPDEAWLLCGGNCFECGCRGVGCWQARKGDIIAFKKH